MSPESHLDWKKTWKCNSSLVQLHFYFNFQLFISTGSQDPKSRIFVLRIFQKMDEWNVAPESSQPVYERVQQVIRSSMPAMGRTGRGTQKNISRSVATGRSSSLP